MADYLTDANNDIKTYFELHDIPTRFHRCFFGEFIKVFGVDFLIPDTFYLLGCDDDGNYIPINEDDYSYKDQISFYLNDLCSTYGWGKAFKAACDQCGIMDIYDDYYKMDWVRSDIFDGYIADKTIEVLFADTEHKDYIQEENAND